MSLPGPSVEEVEDVLCCPTEEDETYVWKLLEAQNNAFLAEFNAVDQQIAKAKWVVAHPVITHPHLLTVILLHERGDFPQSAAIAIYALLKQPTPLRSVVGVGGWLDPDLVPDNNLFRPSWSRGPETPVFLLHDRLDTVVTVKEAHQMLATLEQRDMNVAYIEAAANRLLSVKNMPPAKLGALEIQIIRTLSGLQRIKVPEVSPMDKSCVLGIDIGEGPVAWGQPMRHHLESCLNPALSTTLWGVCLSAWPGCLVQAASLLEIRKMPKTLKERFKARAYLHRSKTQDIVEPRRHVTL
ncbi:hypothetical protein PRZ48_010508 [Zasmidium cellare]|uniref:Phospholipase/carboxylesterase/thioesterase domain-containing protein n=1 Tax=Zasmidium cellare TaxID=395010 RepID=A0ABR0E8U5_ZASCE|nr:hypothetical protein PRZ48_010508 [Zasmidium cellare]